MTATLERLTVCDQCSRSIRLRDSRPTHLLHDTVLCKSCVERALTCDVCNGTGSYQPRVYCGAGEGPEYACEGCAGRGWLECAFCADAPATERYMGDPICPECHEWETHPTERDDRRGSRCSPACGFCGGCS